MNYDMEKIRVACLELMGWRRETQQNWLDKQTDVIWTGPDGKERYEGLPLPSPIPDPTTSLDAALPLIQKYKICLYSPGCSYAGGEYGWREDAWGAEMCDAAYYALDEDFRYDVLCGERRFVSDTAPLAICLCALAASGRNPKDFEASP